MVAMSTMRQRLEEIAADVGSARQIARVAGLRNDNHLNATLARLRKDPDADFEQSMLRKLAEAAGVSVHWLATGEGPKRVTVISGAKSWPSVSAEASKQYPGVPIAEIGKAVTPEPIADVDLALVVDLARAWYAAKERGLLAPAWAPPALDVAPGDDVERARTKQRQATTAQIADEATAARTAATMKRKRK